MPKHIITVESTNNPTIVKFVDNQLLVKGNTYQYNNVDEAKDAPLAKQLFHLPFVSKVFVSTNFIAIEKFDIVQWEEVQEDVRELIEGYLNGGNEVITTVAKPQKIIAEVYAESTPNPSVLKFAANRLISQKAIEFKTVADAQYAPLVVALFNFDFVAEVYLAENYISITKTEQSQWHAEHVQEIRGFIKNYIAAGKLIIDVTKIPTENTDGVATPIENLEGTSLDIANILEEHIKPAVANDGGNISFCDYDPKTKEVSVILQGACSGCPSSTITLKNGIETMLKEMLPGKISSVVAING